MASDIQRLVKEFGRQMENQLEALQEETAMSEDRKRTLLELHQREMQQLENNWLARVGAEMESALKEKRGDFKPSEEEET